MTQTLEAVRFVTLKTGVVPFLTSLAKSNQSIKEYLTVLDKIHFDLAQLYWNSLYTMNPDEEDVLRYNLLELVIETRRLYAFFLRYKTYAVSHRFDMRIACLQKMVTRCYEYLKALGIMM